MNYKIRAFSLSLTLIVLMVSQALFPQVIYTCEILADAGNVFFHPNRAKQMLQQVVTPLSGEQVLPQPVRAMIYLLRTHQVAAFQYSEAIATDEIIRQRLLEGAFPSRFVPTAAHIVLVDGEKIPSSCKVASTLGGVQLAHCG